MKINIFTTYKYTRDFIKYRWFYKIQERIEDRGTFVVGLCIRTNHHKGWIYLKGHWSSEICGLNTQTVKYELLKQELVDWKDFCFLAMEQLLKGWRHKANFYAIWSCVNMSESKIAANVNMVWEKSGNDALQQTQLQSVSANSRCHAAANSPSSVLTVWEITTRPLITEQMHMNVPL